MNIGVMDQALAGLSDMAKISRHYYCKLIDEGFTEYQALKLTGDYIKSIVLGVSNQ